MEAAKQCQRTIRTVVVGHGDSASAEPRQVRLQISRVCYIADQLPDIGEIASRILLFNASPCVIS